MPAKAITTGAAIPLGALDGPVNVLDVYCPHVRATAAAAWRGR
jgi:hypothetical protein